MNSALIHLLPVTPYEPRMSDLARRIVNTSRYLRRLENHRVQFEEERFQREICMDVAALAGEYIALACQDLDTLAWLSKEAAAGRAHGDASEARRRATGPRGLTC